MPTPGESPGAPAPPPAYAGRATELFDDSIAPAAVGYAGDDGLRSADEALLRERTQTADAVVRARVVTITSSEDSDGAIWLVGLRALETLGGKHGERAPGEDFTFRVARRTPAAGIVRALEARLVGTTFIVFVREFDGAADETTGAHTRDAHYYFEKDDKAELEAVRQAGLLGEVRGGLPGDVRDAR